MTSAAVVIPSKDRPDWTAECVASLRAMSIPAEILVLDSSREPAARRLRELLPPGVRTLRGRDWAPAEARNAGAAATDAEVVAFVDDDVLVPSHWLETLLSAFDDAGVMAAGGPTRPLWEAPPPRALLSSRRCLSSLGIVDLGGERRRLRPEDEFLVGANCAYRRQWLLRMGGFRSCGRLPGFGPFGSDYELSRRAAREGVAFFEPRAWVHHRMTRRKSRLPHALKRVFFHEVARAGQGGKLRPRRALRQLAGWEGVVSAAVVLGNVYGRIARPAR